jgi:hypothetical protein
VEIEKALSGAGQSSSMTDGGSGDRIFGKLLSWLNDHTSDVFFIGTCLAGGTLVELADGRICKLESLVGQRETFLSVDDETGQWVSGSGLVYSRGIRDMLRIRTSAGFIDATPDHRFFVFQNGKIAEKEAKHLTADDLLLSKAKAPVGSKPAKRYLPLPARSRQKPVKQPEYLTAELAYFLGFCCGDGGKGKLLNRKAHRLQLSEFSAGLTQHLCSLIRSLFGVEPKVIDKRPKAQSYYIYLDRRLLLDWFEQYFPDILCLQCVREIPQDVMASPDKDVVLSFIAGLFDAEGYISKRGRIEIAVTSPVMIDQLRLLLTRFDIQGSVATISRKLPRKDVTKLSIRDSESCHRFAQLIPFQHPDKKSRICRPKEVNGDGVRSVPGMHDCLEIILKAAGRYTSVLPNYRQYTPLISADTAELWQVIVDHYVAKMSESAAREIADELEQVRRIWSQKWVSVVSVEPSPLGEQTVYDVVIEEPHHSFMASGVVVHNCNNISMLPPEFSRAERFDAVFFVDVPTEEERLAIWQIYLHLYGHAESRTDKVKHSLLTLSEGWTGAEIKACCRLAAIREVSLDEAAKQVVPVTRMADTKLQDLRAWASGRCLNASAPGLYDVGAKQVVSVSDITGGGKRRSVVRPNVN